ncbi:phage tail protein [Kordia sp.]|uniref:phage tail protein n=1 Tax=Kordia sp. TaxID=1965332 RepID=UPI003D26CA33
MATQSKETLKTYFETGDKPTQQQFEDLIDSLNTPFIGEIKTVGFGVVPNGWAKCDGQLLNISEHTTLFNLFGTTYGGDGSTTFGLPDLRGRSPIHEGQGVGLSQIGLGQKGGAETQTLSTAELPNHSHDSGTLKGTIICNEEDATTDDPTGANFGLAQSSTGDIYIYNSEINTASMTPNSVNISGDTGATGSGQAFDIRNPFLCINYIIALKGRNPLTH